MREKSGTGVSAAGQRAMSKHTSKRFLVPITIVETRSRVSFEIIQQKKSRKIFHYTFADFSCAIKEIDSPFIISNFSSILVLYNHAYRKKGNFAQSSSFIRIIQIAPNCSDRSARGKKKKKETSDRRDITGVRLSGCRHLGKERRRVSFRSIGGKSKYVGESVLV